VGSALVVGSLTYAGVRQVLIRRADADVHDILMSHRGLHEYIQQVMHPAFYQARDAKQVEPDFYDPAIFSSSYIVRLLHGFYNAERQKDGQPAIDYKMAADNPRNPVNRADPEESRLIQRFNRDRSLRQHREVVRREGKTYLVHAIPFMENKPACLRCHGRRAEAPPGLQALYPGEGGFNEPLGMIRAVEIIRVPLDPELTGAAVTTASLTAGLLTLAALFLFNRHLRARVRLRTTALEQEVQERRRTERALAEARAQLSEALRMARIGHWRLDLDTRTFTFTDEFYAVLRTTAEAMGGYTMGAEAYADRFLEPEERVLVGTETQKALESQDPGYRGTVEHRVRFGDGETGYLLVHYHVERDAEGRPLATCGVNQDITERKRAEEAARDARMQLVQAQKLESLGLLAGGVAHDMNNVLGAILGLATVLRSTTPAQQETACATIIAACERGKGLVRRLLDFARRELEVEQVLDLNALIREEIALLERTTLQRVRLVEDLDPTLRPLLGDRNALGAALLNLCVNAVDAMPEGGTLTLRTRNAGDQLLLEVEDTGVGMAPEVVEKALEPFVTTKAAGKGTGLGLSMVYGFVRHWGGDVRIYSEPGLGTTVRLLLPAAPVQGAPTVLQSQGQKLRGREHLLVVEDDPEVASIAKAQLRSLGYQVTESASINGAIEALTVHRDIRLVFTDVVLLGGETGFQLADRLRVEQPELPVLFCSGYAEAALEDHFSAGAERPRILAKPYAREDLGAAIRALLDRKPGRAGDARR